MVFVTLLDSKSFVFKMCSVRTKTPSRRFDSLRSRRIRIRSQVSPSVLYASNLSSTGSSKAG